MKKFLIIMTVLVVGILTLGFVFYIKTGQIPTYINVKEFFTENDVTQVQETVPKNIFVFNAPEYKDVIEEALPASQTKTVYICVDRDYYFPIELPEDTEIVSDYSKYIYGKDSSFAVTVVSNIGYDTLSKDTGIKNAVNVTNDLIRSPEGAKRVQEAARYVLDDKAIIIRAYNNPVVFATVLRSLNKNTYKDMSQYHLAVVPQDPEKPDEPYTRIINYVPIDSGYHPSIKIGYSDSYQEFYVYDDGFLTVAKEFKLFEEEKEYLNRRAAVYTKMTMLPIYFGGKDTVYYECGDCTVGIKQINYNTAIGLFGVGKEARYNIAYYLRTYN